MVVYKASSFEVKYEEEQLHLTIVSNSKSEEFKLGLINALDYAQKFAIKSWLFDLRQTDCLGEEEVNCLFDYFLPEFMIKLGTDNFVSILISETCYHKLLSKVGSTGMGSYSSFIKMNAFYNYDEAINWLKYQKKLQPL